MDTKVLFSEFFKVAEKYSSDIRNILVLKHALGKTVLSH